MLLLEVALREAEQRLAEKIDGIGPHDVEIDPEATPVSDSSSENADTDITEGEEARPIQMMDDPEPTSSGGMASETSEFDDGLLISDVAGTYQRAMTALKAGQHEVAAKLFRALALQFPDHDLAPNAMYWLGETYYGRYKYSGAIPVFQQVTERYPKSGKAPDALLKLGKCHERMGKIDEAIAVYERVIREFPDSAAARLARSWM